MNSHTPTVYWYSEIIIKSIIESIPENNICLRDDVKLINLPTKHYFDEQIIKKNIISTFSPWTD